MTTLKLPKNKISIDTKTASTADLVKFYNEHSGSRPIVKFSDRKTAEHRVEQLIQAHNELACGTSKTSNLKKIAKMEEKPKTNNGSEEKASRGRTSEGTGKKIFKLGDHKTKNPRREGTHGWKSWEIIKDGMSYEDYVAAGGRNRDLMHDVKLGRIELR